MLELFSFVLSFCSVLFFSSSRVSNDFTLSDSAPADSVLENSRDFKILQQSVGSEVQS